MYEPFNDITVNNVNNIDIFFTGMNVMRLNFSHGSHEHKAGLISMLRKEVNYAISFILFLNSNSYRLLIP